MAIGALTRYTFPELKRKKQRLELEQKIQEFLKPKRDLIIVDRDDIQIVDDKLGRFLTAVSGSVTVRHKPTGYTRVVYVSQGYEKETYNPYVIYSCTRSNPYNPSPVLWFRTMSQALCSVWGDESWISFSDNYPRELYKFKLSKERDKFSDFMQMYCSIHKDQEI